MAETRAEREARLAAALRDNLKKRKAQARARDADAREAQEPAPTALPSEPGDRD